jgi:curved DNA-binding protein CbpA
MFEGIMTKRDYYEVLNVSRGADGETIKKNYRKLALQFHPDKVPEEDKIKTEEKFKLINTAYSILMDRTQRRQYDLSYSDY